MHCRARRAPLAWGMTISRGQPLDLFAALFVTLLALAPQIGLAVEGFKIDLQEVDTVPTVTAEAIVAAPAERLWAIIDRCADYKDTMVSILASRELWRKGNKRSCDITADLPFPLPNLRGTTEAINTIEPGKRWRRTWHLTEGDYVTNNGSWTLTPVDAQRTHVVYTLAAKPHITIPAFATRIGQRQVIPALFAKIEAQAQGRAPDESSPPPTMTE